MMDTWVVSTFLAIVNSATTVYLDVQVSVQVSAFSSFGSIPRSGIAGSYGNSVFNFLRNCNTVSHSSRAILHSHQQLMRAPNRCTSSSTLILLYKNKIKAILMDVKCYLIVVCLAFPWWLMMLSIFTCAYWPFVCLWRNVFSGPFLAHFLSGLFALSAFEV